MTRRRTRLDEIGVGGQAFTSGAKKNHIKTAHACTISELFTPSLHTYRELTAITKLLRTYVRIYFCQPWYVHTCSAHTCTTYFEYMELLQIGLGCRLHTFWEQQWGHATMMLRRARLWNWSHERNAEVRAAFHIYVRVHPHRYPSPGKTHKVKDRIEGVYRCARAHKCIT